jgi:hypothetical protein
MASTFSASTTSYSARDGAVLVAPPLNKCHVKPLFAFLFLFVTAAASSTITFFRRKLIMKKKIANIYFLCPAVFVAYFQHSSRPFFAILL